MDNSLESVLNKSKSILIVLPTNPYFDQVASALALSLSLRGRKETTVYSPTPMTVEFNRLVGVNKIKNEIGDKNLVIKFTEYDGKNVERVSADIENGLFQLTIIPKQDALAPQKNQIDLSYSGVGSDTVVLIGGASDVHFPILASGDLAGAKFVHIGIRPLALSEGKAVQSFARDASSICEIVAGLMTNNSLQNGQVQDMPFFALEADVATNLVMGIELTTNSFTTSMVTANTFSVMASLMMAGGQRQPQRPIPDNFPPGSIPQAKPSPQKTEVNTSQNQVSTDQRSATPNDWLGKPKIYKGTDLKSS